MVSGYARVNSFNNAVCASGLAGLMLIMCQWIDKGAAKALCRPHSRGLSAGPWGCRCGAAWQRRSSEGCEVGSSWGPDRWKVSLGEKTQSRLLLVMQQGQEWRVSQARSPRFRILPHCTCERDLSLYQNRNNIGL